MPYFSWLIEGSPIGDILLEMKVNCFSTDLAFYRALKASLLYLL